MCIFTPMCECQSTHYTQVFTQVYVSTSITICVVSSPQQLHQKLRVQVPTTTAPRVPATTAPETSRSSPYKVKLPFRLTWTPQMTTASVGRQKSFWRKSTNFGQKTSIPAGQIVRASTSIWLVYVCTQILQIDTQHSLPVISKFVLGWHHQDNSGHQNAGLTGITLADGREWKEIYCIRVYGAKSWLLCALASLPTSGPVLREDQIEQWSIYPRAFTTYTAFLHTVCIFELGMGISLSSIVSHLKLKPPLVSRSPGPLINMGGTRRQFNGTFGMVPHVHSMGQDRQHPNWKM